MADIGPDLHNKKQYPGMVGWFDPPMLLRIAREAIVSALFGQYADRRLIQAALDPANDAELVRRADLTGDVQPDGDGAVWLDYVADLGDGFDSTYAVAYLLGQQAIDLEGTGSLPRGQVLIMGGDQVYPAATYENYKLKMLRPYRFAFPDTIEEGASHPPVFLIPGNHDWYDGLTQFLALFCRAREKHIGSWRTRQRRSYFALKLPNDWWIWAFDSQLGEDIDQPQADYFAAIARAMPEGAKVVVCAAIPSWMYDSARFRRGIEYIANNILLGEAKTADVYAVLSGDTHHYNRYSDVETGTQFITAGGGGAFLHPTHTLKDDAEIKWLGSRHRLSLKTTPDATHAPTEESVCYPSRDESRKMLKANLRFPLANPLFFVTLGGLYWVAALFLMLWRGDELAPQAIGSGAWMGLIASTTIGSPAFLVLLVALAGILIAYVNDEKDLTQKVVVGAIHAIPHLAIILALVSFFPPLNSLVGAYSGSDWFFLLFAVEVVFIGGFAGAFVWGVYLLVACGRFNLHSNDGFSAMRIADYKLFLRLRITNDELTIYPIALDRVPKRSEWKWNSTRSESQNEPRIVPTTPLKPHLIEGPVIVKRA